MLWGLSGLGGNFETRLRSWQLVRRVASLRSSTLVVIANLLNNRYTQANHDNVSLKAASHSRNKPFE